MTIIISSHILEELYQVANRFGIINEGKLVREISKEEFELQSQDFIVLTTDEVGQASQIIIDQLDLQMKVVDERTIHIFGYSHRIDDIIKVLSKHGVPVNGIAYSKQSLETFFTDIVTNNEGE